MRNRPGTKINLRYPTAMTRRSTPAPSNFVDNDRQKMGV
jgi:hypothetical protein